jgi:hypothetical protein
MYCPNCSSENDKNQNFCRFCGFNLTEAAKSLKLQLAFGERAYKLKKSDKIKRTMNRATDLLFVLFFLGLLAVSIIDFTNLNFYLRLSVSVFAVLYVSRKLFDFWQFRRTDLDLSSTKELTPAADRKLESPETQKFLEPNSGHPQASIAENPTRILHAEAKTRKID